MWWTLLPGLLVCSEYCERDTFDVLFLVTLVDRKSGTTVSYLDIKTTRERKLLQFVDPTLPGGGLWMPDTVVCEGLLKWLKQTGDEVDPRESRGWPVDWPKCMDFCIEPRMLQGDLVYPWSSQCWRSWISSVARSTVWGTYNQGHQARHSRGFVPCRVNMVHKIPLMCDSCYVGQTRQCLNTQPREHAVHLEGTLLDTWQPTITAVSVNPCFHPWKLSLRPEMR